MPKNTYLIKESYKKVEEIREIKSEIPTYEEFLKNYNTDEKVNDSYDNELNFYSDIGTTGGYGPCNYVNRDCSCYVSSGFISLYMSCPSCSDTNNHVWTHNSDARLSTSNQSSNCRGNLLISSHLSIKCADCGAEGSWREWMFSCSQHNGYKYTASCASFMDALVTGLRIQVSNPALADLVKRISIRLIEENR